MSSWISRSLVERLNLKPVKKIDTKVRTIRDSDEIKCKIYELELYNTEGDFEIPVTCIKTSKPYIFQAAMPSAEITAKIKHDHPKLQEMHLPISGSKVDLVLGTIIYNKIKTSRTPVGNNNGMGASGIITATGG